MTNMHRRTFFVTAGMTVLAGRAFSAPPDSSFAPVQRTGNG